MATNFGTKIAINAYKYISMRDNENAITYNGVFVAEQSKGDMSDCNCISKGRCHGNQILAKIGKKNITKMAIASVVCNISIQGLVL